MNQWDDFLIRKFDPYAFAKYKILIEWMGTLHEQAVLVVGSGSGEFACMLAKQGARVEAIDISTEAVALTEATALQYEVKIKTHVSFLENFESNGKFDWVIATDIIEHIEDDKSAVQKMVLLTKVGGKILVTVPAMQLLFGHHDRILGHYRRYSKTSLKSLFGISLCTRKLRYFGFSLIPIAFLFSKILKVSYPVKAVGLRTESTSWIGKFLNLIFYMERKISFPLGTSLLLMAEKIQGSASGNEDTS